MFVPRIKPQPLIGFILIGMLATTGRAQRDAPADAEKAREEIRSKALISQAPASKVTPIYENEFNTAAVEKAPEGMMAISGDFLVKQEAGNKFLELPGEPLDTFGVLFGPAESQQSKVGEAVVRPLGNPGRNVSARIFGTKKGRKFPAFGVSLGGVGGYRLMVSAGKKTLEIFKGDEVKTSVPFEWTDDAWTTLRLQVRKTADGCLIEGKAWASDGAEPAAWLIKLEEKSAPPQGRAGVWGSPYSGTPIRFDDLLVAPAS